MLEKSFSKRGFLNYRLKKKRIAVLENKKFAGFVSGQSITECDLKAAKIGLKTHGQYFNT